MIRPSCRAKTMKIRTSFAELIANYYMQAGAEKFSVTIVRRAGV